MTRFCLALAVAAGALAAVPDTVTGCAAVYRPGTRVDTTEESALIVWDDKAKVEHFVRRANFRSTGYDFGFLVPTPNRPDLDVANDDLFAELATITAPKVEYQELVVKVEKRFSFSCAKQEAFAFVGAAQKPAGGVAVLEQKRVGDYDATVLAFRRDDGDSPDRGGKELAEWLAKHGYESPPAIDTWLQKYINDGWCITAFKIASTEPQPGAASAPEGGTSPDPKVDPKPAPRPRDLRAKPIRMSFKTDRPFYPYREPETEQAKSAAEARLLRVFFAAPVRYAGKLGGTKPWPGETVWAGPVDAPHWTSLYQKSALTDPPTKDSKPTVAMPVATDGYWLTEFEDRSSPRPGTDEVYFEPAADQLQVARPPNVIHSARTEMVTPWWHMAVYFGVPAVLVLGGLGAWRLLRRA
jgi:hypothetical protein